MSKSPAELFANAERDPEKLKAVYEQLGQLPATEAVAQPPPKARNAADRWADAKEVVQPLMRMFLLKCSELALGPEDIVFAAELFALNVLNAVDYPGTPAAKAAAIKAADDYFAASLPKVPVQPPLGR